jgi:gluconolactonase
MKKYFILAGTTLLLIVFLSITLFAKENSSVQSLNQNSQKLEKIASGFDFVEGPVWIPSGYLIFSDIPADTLYKYQQNQPVEVFRKPSGNANGNTLDKQGNLITAEHKNRRVSRTGQDGKIISLADKFEGKLLNSPNDVIVKSDGSIYFTDPPYGIQKKDEQLAFYGVYRIAPDGQLSLLAKDFIRPNGLAFSPDEKKLYINDTEKNHMRVFDIKPDGTLAGGQVFVEMKEEGKNGVPDGIKVDIQGNIYSTGPGGIWVFSPTGQLINKIEVPESATNLAWGDEDYKTLYITAGKSLYKIRLTIAGIKPGLN